MSKKRLKLTTSISCVISLISFLYKLGVGIYSISLILIIASIPTLMLFIAKLMFVKNVNKTREKKKKAYSLIFFVTLMYSIIFLLFVVLRVNGIDISKKNTYEGWLGIVFIGVLILLFILSVINLVKSLEKTDLMVIGLKEITFVAALADLIIIEEFINEILLFYMEENVVITSVHNFFPLALVGVMLITSFCMLVRLLKYNTKINN